MNMVRYTLGRLGLFLAVLLLVLPISVLSLPMKLLVALVVSFPLSWFLLRGWRDRASADLAAWVERRRAEKARLRAALAGEDEAGPPDQQPNRPQDQPNDPPQDLPRGRSENPLGQLDPHDRSQDPPQDPLTDSLKDSPQEPPPAPAPGRPEDQLWDQPPGRPEDQRQAG